MSAFCLADGDGHYMCGSPLDCSELVFKSGYRVEEPAVLYWR